MTETKAPEHMELLPCPFCGADGELHEEDDFTYLGGWAERPVADQIAQALADYREQVAQQEREKAAKIAFDAVMATAERPYSTLQKAACVAASIRNNALAALEAKKDSRSHAT